MLVPNWVLLIALSFHFVPDVTGQIEGADEVSGMLNSRTVEDALKLVAKSLEETLEKMKESLGADLQVVLAEMSKKGEDFGNEVGREYYNLNTLYTLHFNNRVNCVAFGMSYSLNRWMN